VKTRPAETPARVRRVVLTGGIATGKSYTLQRFAMLGAPTCDADDVARTVQAPNGAAWSGLRDRFGPDVFDASGHLNRRVLGAVVFSDPQALADLNALVHPHVRQAIEHWLAELDPASGPALVAIPLYFEGDRVQTFERVVVTACDLSTQVARVVKRGFTEEEARQRIAAQLPTEEKARQADHVVWTDRRFADTDRQVEKVWAVLTQP
jgi:dephospho-CoA kinase